MKSGDYLIHVYVQQGKMFNVIGNDTCNPFIEITCCNKIKFTTNRENVPCNSKNIISWNEHLFIEPKSMNNSVISNEVIQIKIKNKGFFKDELIGQYDYDITTIYFQENHTIQHQWIAFSNPEASNQTEVSGLLRLSISIQAEGDKQILLNDAPPDALDESDSVLLIPSQIKKEYKQLKIRFLMAEYLPQLDNLGTIDAYVMMNFGGVKYKTNVVKQKDNRTPFYFEWWIPLQWPFAVDRITLKIYDEDNLQYDEIVGTLNFSLTKICALGQKPGGYMQWFNIQGAPLNKTGVNSDLMNNIPELASSFKGRILLYITCEDVIQPEMKQQPLNQNENAVKLATDKKLLNFKYSYQIQTETRIGIALLGKKQYHIKIQIGEFSQIITNPAADGRRAENLKAEFNRWNERQTYKVELPYPSVELMGNVYIYLMDGNVPISYAKILASEFENEDPEFCWIKLKADMSIGAIKGDQDAGMILMKLVINDVSKNGEIDFATKYPLKWGKKIGRANICKIRCFIFQCKDIPAADDDGLPDCYISIWNQDGERKVTKVIQDSLCPQFFECIELDYAFFGLEDAPPLILNLFDKNVIMADEYLGRAIINLKDAAKNQMTPNFFNENVSDQVKNSIPKPDWYPIRFSNDESMPITGQILCSFVFVPGDSVFAPIRAQKIQQSIPRKDYVVDIQILCLRELQSFGLMPVRKPFLRFNLKDLLPPEKMAGFSNIQTEPSSGANPNINTLLTFSMSLPEEDLYCPYLQVDVFDFIFLGLSQPLIGAFQISIGTEKDDSKQRNIVKLKNANDIIQSLQKHLNTSLEELKTQKSGRKQNYDPLLNQLVDRKLKKQSKSKGNSQQQLSNPQIRAITNDIRTRLVKNYQPQIDEENPIQLNFLQLRDSQQDEPIGFDKLQKDLEQLQVQQKQLEKQITDLQSTTKAKEQNLSDREVEIKIKELSTQLINVKIEKKKVKEQLQNLDRKSDQIQLKNERQNFSDILILPQYTLNAELNMYEEIEKPKESIYMSVGYNDYVNITKYITGNDLDKRLKQQIAQGDQVQQQIAEDSVIQRKYQMSKMHYRKFYNQELESVKTIFTEQIFDEYKIFRGAQRGTNHSIFSMSKGKVDESGQVSNRKQVGIFKGLVDIFNVEERKRDNELIDKKLKEIYNLLSQIYEKSYGQGLNISIDQLSTKKGVSEFWLKMEDCFVDTKLIKAIYRDSISYDKVKKQLNQKFNCTCRLYILEGYDFASRDICSASDPYIKITCGSQVYDERDNFQLDQPNPKFFKFYSISTTFPCSPWIMIQAFDHNDLFGDELIGSTKIDLDDRFFNQKWQELNEKPIEFRQLQHHSSSLSQGLISMWLEIDENVKQQNPKKVWPLDPEPIRDYQLRVCIYDTQNIPKMDIEGTSDVYITSYVYYKEKQSTDTHYRCMDGHASFNYRMTFDVKAPCQEFMLVLQAWDRDLLTRNEYICEWTIDLIRCLKIVQLTQKSIHLKKTFYEKQKEKYFKNIELEFLDEDSFWLTVKRDGKDIKIRLDLRLLPKFEAEACKVGMARTEPNIEPYLPPPVGRMIMTLNPCRMLDQLVSPQFKRKIMMFLCLAICLILLISMIPMITSNFFSSFMISLITPAPQQTIIYQSQPTQASSNDIKNP